MAGKIIFERIKNVTHVGQFENFNNNIQFAKRIGQCLAIIHSNYKLSDNLVDSLPNDLANINSKQVFIHGDFTGNNILFHQHNDKLFIIDWMMTKIHEEKATFGTVYFDIAWFLNFQYFSQFSFNYLKRNIE